MAGDCRPSSASVDNNSYQSGATVVVLGNTGSLVKTGFVFTGWNTAANGSGDYYAAANTFFIIADDVILYAKWTPYTVGDVGPAADCTEVGGGYMNTTYIVSYLGSGSTYAAQLCDGLTFGAWGFTNWFLPSKGELDLMYTNLASQGLGDLSGHYRSSSESGTNGAWVQYMSDGSQSVRDKDEDSFVRVQSMISSQLTIYPSKGHV